MSSNKNITQKLPDGWVLCSSKSNPGRKYYFNRKTGKSSWSEPQADDKSGQSKEKSKREKAKKNEKLKKIEAQRKATKRKSDSQEGSSAKKKNKTDHPSPEKRVRPSPSKHNVVPKASKTSPKKGSPPQKTPSKNIANSRLTQLRARLSAEIEKNVSVTENSPTKHKVSPKINETPPKISKLETKSPQLNDTKCSTTNQSPSSDSIQSIPSPSQFFAANKIISSMKAQLPEKYCDKTKQKDTFADIEEGICNQTAEYPFMKHPATPPQFSEASKLVSAIKSKLSYKGVSKEGNLETFRSAQDRMNAMRSRFSNETATSEDDAVVNVATCNDDVEAMDVDCKEISQNVPVVPVQHTNEKVNFCRDNKDDLVLVVDTNVFIHELDSIKNVLNSHIEGYKEQPTLLVPWRVISELDRLKDNNNGNGVLCKRAKSAMDYLYKSLPENSRIKGQSLRDSNSHIYPCEVPDDEILNCCLQQAERGKSVILVSNDKNLCNKAVINSVKCMSTCELRPARAHARCCRDALRRLLAAMLENEMRAKYNNLWQHILFKAPPWTLDDVLQCLLKHWIAVFNEVFPRVVEHLITDLRNSLLAIESKDPKSVSQAEVANFQELCLEIAKKCQIIPEYMELAKLTVERIEKKEAAEEDTAAVDAFEALWRIFSRYCDALSKALGIPHNIQVESDVPSNETLEALLERFSEFTHHIRILTESIQGVLSDSSGPLDHRVSRLCVAISDSLLLLGVSSKPSVDCIQTFCDTSSNMLEEAHTKFAQLVDLLDSCQRSIQGN
ncbi:transcriptional protein SWT1 [Plodia interpunctella]|uniref:transcriptional protein SWT1 n=1 Tax=Plodia interpunctella TaxID=58824 RepID=UPI0023680C70|nr:transcriptional protein SWT1 [Plodia interpunctella]